MRRASPQRGAPATRCVRTAGTARDWKARCRACGATAATDCSRSPGTSPTSPARRTRGIAPRYRAGALPVAAMTSNEALLAPVAAGADEGDAEVDASHHQYVYAPASGNVHVFAVR